MLSLVPNPAIVIGIIPIKEATEYMITKSRKGIEMLRERDIIYIWRNRIK